VTSADRTLSVSHDELTGEWFFPPRAISVDGTLRELPTVEVPAVGTLTEAVEMGDRWYGYVDLAGDIRILTELGAGPHEIGRRYRLVSGDDETRRFDRA
jgi:hypothetical protein